MSALQNRPPAPIDNPPDNAWVALDRLASHLAAGGRNRRWSTRSTFWALALGSLLIIALVVLMTGLVAFAYVLAGAGPWGIASLTAVSALVSGHALRRRRRSTRLVRSGRAAGGRRRPS